MQSSLGELTCTCPNPTRGRLRSLTEDWPHAFALPAAAVGDGSRPWEPRDDSEKAISLAYKKATLHLHPDRMKSAGRDPSVRVEAEEVLKVLTRSHAAGKERWLDCGGVRSASASSSAHHPEPEAAAHPTEAREHVFGRSTASTSNDSTSYEFRNTSVSDAPAPRDSGADHNGGTGLRDEIFGSRPAAPQTRPSRPGPPSRPEVNPFESNPFAAHDHPAAFDGATSAADDLFRSAPFTSPQPSADSAASPNPFADDLFRTVPRAEAASMASSASDPWAPSVGAGNGADGRGLDNPFGRPVPPASAPPSNPFD